MENLKPKFHFQRFEFKYQVPQKVVAAIIPDLLKYMDVDPYAQQLPGNSYLVSSLYYDTIGLAAYYEKIDGLRVRKKLRLRFYGEELLSTTPVFLEIKRKYDAVVVKDRLALDLQTCYAVLHGAMNIRASLAPHLRETLDEFLWLQQVNCMMPQVLIQYWRRPFVSKIDPGVRVTIDTDIRASRADWLGTTLQDPREVQPGWSILEIKYLNILPAWFEQIIRQYNLIYLPLSKYCSSQEMCQPQLTVLPKTMTDIYAPASIPSTY